MRRFGPSWSVAGWSIGLLVGALALVVVRLLPGVTAMNMPILLLIGVAWASVVGAYIGGRVVRGSGRAAIGYAIVMGVGVAALTAASVVPVPPFVLIAVGVSPVVWPITLPAAGIWVGMLRWTPLRMFLDRPIGVIVAMALSSGLLIWRFQVPLVVGGVDRELCASYPGERIEVMAWSPNGRWLAFASENDHILETVRLLDASAGTIETLDAGTDLAATLGLAVDDSGMVSYLGTDMPIPDSFDLGLALRTSAVGRAPTQIGAVPRVGSLIGTPDGLVGLVETSGYQRPVWIRVTTGTVHLVELTEDELPRYPEVGITLAPYDGSFVIETSSGARTIAMPLDAAHAVNLSADRRYLVFEDRTPTADGDETLRLIAQSIETGQRIVLRHDDAAWDARVAGGRLAYLTWPDDDNRVCVSRLDPALGL